MTTEPRIRLHLASACLIAALCRGAVVAATQAPASPRLTGEAPPPASALSLWYRAPASDHPLLPLDAPRREPPGRHRRVGSRPSGRQRPARRDGLRRRRARAAAAERGHAVGRAAVRSGEPGREGRAARGPASARRAQVRRGGEARRREGDVEAARADAVPDGRRSGADVSAGRCGRELPARSRSGDGDGSRVVHERWRDVLARGVRERTRPGHRRAADRQPSRADLLRGADADAAARDRRGDARTAISSCAASTATAPAPPPTAVP